MQTQEIQQLNLGDWVTTGTNQLIASVNTAGGPLFILFTGLISIGVVLMLFKRFTGK